MVFVKSPASTLDYTFDWSLWLPTGDTILTTSWTAATGITIANLSTPSGLTLTPSGTGGTFAAGTYFWKITATTANGETTGSNEVTTTLSGSTSSATLNWPVQPNATHIKVYRGTATNAEVLLTTLAGTAVTYVDTGTATTSGSVPGSNTATITTNTSTAATVWVAGGSAGQSYTISGTITTAQGRIDQRTQTINVVAL